MEGIRFNLSWYGNGVGGVEVLAKGELCEEGVVVRRVSDRVMAVVLVFEEDVLRFVLWVCSARWKTFGRKAVFL